jgi:hypothetical protein
MRNWKTASSSVPRNWRPPTANWKPSPTRWPTTCVRPAREIGSLGRHAVVSYDRQTCVEESFSTLAWVGMRVYPDVAVAMVTVRLSCRRPIRTLYAGPWYLDRERRLLARDAAQSRARESQAGPAWHPY